jgi:hypothetical protein
LENFFVLGTEETRFLFSLQAFIVQKDIEATTNWSIRQKKDTWLSNWCTALTNGMAQPLVRNSEKLLGALVPGELDSMPQTRKRLVLFETCVFHPYFSLNGEKVEQLDSESEAWQQTLNVLIDRIGVSPALLSEAKNRYETALKELPPSNFWAILASTIGFIVICALTAGFAAPIIGAAVGGLMGLSGAVATSAGLAFLGGGALATGGFGVAGGTAALVGGGSVVGTAAGVALSSLFSSCDHLLVQQLAKLEASCCILFRDHPAHSELLRKVMIRLSEMESKFRSEEKEFKEQGKSKEARNAEKSAALIARTRNRLSP